VWANIAADSYFRFSGALSFAVNEIGMAVVLGLITQEIVEAAMPGGALHSWRRWGMPIFLAAGGAVGAVSVYFLVVAAGHEPELFEGWPIASAIDIAAAYYVLKVILPRGDALPFILLLAIATDAFGLAVVALWHQGVPTQTGGAALMIAALGTAGLMRWMKVRVFWPYLTICGTLSWLAFYIESVHPALALVPIVPFLPHERRGVDLFADPPDDDATHHFEHEWNHAMQVILFLFVLVNAGMVVQGYGSGTWALLAAAVIGRPLGILTAVVLAVAAGFSLPSRIGWRELLVIALATSTGFTFALFFATGVLPVGPALAQLKLGALATVSGALLSLAAAWLLRVGRFGGRRRARRTALRAHRTVSHGHPIPSSDLA
jgi:NhaA family Na+:H+ antiporter